MSSIVSKAPALRFKNDQGNEYQDWEVICLKQLGETYGGLSGKSKDDFGDGKQYVQYLQVFENSKVDLENCGLVRILQGENQHRVGKGDVLFTISSETRDEVGISSVVLDDIDELYLNSFCFGLRLNSNKLSPDFARYLFRNHEFRREMYRLSQGSTRFNLSKKAVMRVSVLVPHHQEQQKIAAFLTSIDTRIEELEKRKSMFEQFKKGLMQKLFSQEIQFKDDQGKEFPEWEAISLSQLGETYGGLSGKSKDDFGDGKKYVQYLQVYENSKVELENCGLVRILQGENQHRVCKGDVLFTISSETRDEVGISSVILDEVDELYLNSFCFGLRLKSNKLSPDFARYLFRNHEFRREMYRLSQGSTRFNLSKKAVMRVSVLVPHHQEQQKIASYLSSIDRKIKLNSEQIEKTRIFKRGLFQQMFA